MSQLNTAIAGVEAEIARLQTQLAAQADQCRGLIQEQEALRLETRADFDALARLQAEASSDASPVVARDLLLQSDADLDRRERRGSALEAELQALAGEEQAMQQRTLQAAATRDAAGERLQLLQERIEATLGTEAGFQALREDLQLAEGRLDTAERMAASAQEERDAKAGAYQADPIFMYLVARDFGGPSYRGWPLVRTIDGWLADLCGFARTRREYTTLVELPPYLQHHAQLAREQVEAARRPVQEARESALALAGGGVLRSALQDAQGALAQALLSEQLQRQAVDSTQAQIDAFRSWTDSEGKSVLATLARALSSKDLGDLYRRVAATATNEDDAVLERIHSRHLRLAEIEGRVGQHTGDMQRLKQSLESLQATRRSYQLAADAERRSYRPPIRNEATPLMTSLFATSSNARRSSSASGSLFDLLAGSSSSSRSRSSSSSSSSSSSNSRSGSSSSSGGGGSFHSGGGISGGGGFKTGGGF
ncbi:TPA: hypothetical protein QEL15_000008 [Stenotrophomonas maltophilia]|nr:hypothetical protein [Stenotrophomonas maltophilia]